MTTETLSWFHKQHCCYKKMSTKNSSSNSCRSCQTNFAISWCEVLDTIYVDGRVPKIPPSNSQSKLIGQSGYYSQWFKSPLGTHLWTNVGGALVQLTNEWQVWCDVCWSKPHGIVFIFLRERAIQDLDYFLIKNIYGLFPVCLGIPIQCIELSEDCRKP